MPDQDLHRDDLRSLTQLGLICLTEAAINRPSSDFPLEAHLRLTGISGALLPTFSISFPAMEIGQAHLPRGKLASEANSLLAERSPPAGYSIDPWRLNTARTVAKFRLNAPPSAHDLIEILRDAQQETPDDTRLRL
jgi:hypothetical protein